MNEKIDWASVLATVADLATGEQVIVDAPGDRNLPQYLGRLRSMLASRRDTKNSKWSVFRAGERKIRIVRRAHAPSTEPFVESLLADIDRRIAELRAVRRDLLRVYGEKKCQSS